MEASTETRRRRQRFHTRRRDASHPMRVRKKTTVISDAEDEDGKDDETWRRWPPISARRS
eukprot:5688738-Lingulodinium_polyedra.AAC.1